MKDRIKIILAILVFVPSLVAFSFQQQQEDKPKKQKPKIYTHESELARELEKARLELMQSKIEISDEIRKRDSIDNERKVNIEIANKSVTDLQKSNKAYEKSLKKLIYVVGKFNPDSVMKFYGEYKDPTDIQIDTTKKKIEYPKVEVPKPKKKLWQRLFGVTY